MLILNVDDDGDDREVFFDALKTVDSRISCIQMESGIKALKFLAEVETLPDYVFMDINMPKMNGYECVERIRSMPHMNNMQIVMYSTTFNPNDKIYFTTQGVKYLVKKSRFSELVEALRSLVNNGVRELEEESKM